MELELVYEEGGLWNPQTERKEYHTEIRRVKNLEEMVDVLKQHGLPTKIYSIDDEGVEELIVKNY